MPRLILLIASVCCSSVAFVACGAPMAPTKPGAVPSSPAPQGMPLVAPATARYSVVFESTWSVSTHPTNFPGAAHYSRLIGATHSPAATFWQEGSQASEGIRLMAERGAMSPLDTEVAQAISARTAEHVLSAPALGTSPGSATMEFEISQAFPLVTLVTMIAPSPDWFVGVAGVALYREAQWMDALRLDLHGFDAGTDSGETYAAADIETSPRQAIARLRGYPVASEDGVRPFGTFTFRRVQ